MVFFSLLLAASSATAPVPNMTTDWWSDYYDWPTQGLAPNEISVVVADIEVNTYGGFAGCVGHSLIGNPQMGAYVCSRLKMRATFKPARGPNGKKITGVYRKVITVANVRNETRFKIPNFGIRIHQSAANGGDNPFEIQFYLDSNGAVSDCSLIDFVGINAEKHKQIADPKAVDEACAKIPVYVEAGSSGRQTWTTRPKRSKRDRGP